MKHNEELSSIEEVFAELGIDLTKNNNFANKKVKTKYVVNTYDFSSNKLGKKEIDLTKYIKF